MFSCYIFLSVLSLSGFLSDCHVFGCDEKCADQPVFSPPRLVVELGTSASASCSVCREDCRDKLSGLENSIGRKQRNGTTILWTVDKMNEWPSSILCYYNKGNGSQCCTTLPITVYQPPKKVEVGFLNHDGPMLEGQEYQLYCRVEEVAPLKNLIVTLYQGENALGRHHLKNNTEKKSSDKMFTNVINATKEIDGARYKCVARLDLETDGPLNDTISNIVTSTVYYKPQFNGPTHGPVRLTAGDPLHLNCSAEGNPRPSVTWILPSAAPSDFKGRVLSVDSVTTEHKGQYICSISNSMGRTTVVFNVDVQVNYTNIILAVVAALVGLVILVIILLYVHYYRLSRTGEYKLKDVLRFRSPHIALPAGEL
ncbi:vascular cell adhesion protein 1-like isoform X1 [Phyllopteryx taeniolatus]|uniref:vascular cell adhesion protein 1-like isoform X1 n=1 Tax=Phyllopteryx taeniolatus TaxID=161469 RepID=UPI002AD53916|nr:vascular cell adhesion protein 1-like isoform X1 [Phyllopteryx taeniolatus]